MKKSGKMVYLFGGGTNDGDGSMKELLGGKGANLAEMAYLNIPVPAGFTITTEVCTAFMKSGGKYPGGYEKELKAGLAHIEKVMGMKFGDAQNPLLLSVRSGARSSMPGMMETVLNIGLNDVTRDALIAKTGNPRFVYDAQRRLIQMYSDVVMEKATGIEPAEGMGVRTQLEKALHAMKGSRGVKLDTELTADDLKELVDIYKAKVLEVLGVPFPEGAMEQLWGGVGAVFKSWNGKRACSYRRIENIPDDWGTAVNVQAMVFGNMGDTSATGVAFTRNPANGDPTFYGEWLVNAQGEDVVAGIRTPNPLNEANKTEGIAQLVSLEKSMPKLYRELHAIRDRLEEHYSDMLDIEFTIQEGRLWMLQCRVGKRNGPAAVRMAMDMFREKMIGRDEAVLRVSPAQLDELLHPILDPAGEKTAVVITKGLPAGPGGAAGQAVFTAADAVAWAKQGKMVILVREETNPEDIEGMRAAKAVLTARGGMTSHAALVARGWGKCCIVGAGSMAVDVHTKTFAANGKTYAEGDWISLNGTKGCVYEGEIPMVDSTQNPYFSSFMKLCDGIRRLNVRTNADTPEDAARARSFGAEGIGLFRTEHMFYGKGSDVPLFLLRKMIVSQSIEERRKALDELFPFVKKDIKETLEAMEGLPVTIRLLDPPLHEFIPHQADRLAALAGSLGISVEVLESRAEGLRESNPMMGHRGVRLGISYPEVTEMQIRAILESAAELIAERKKVMPEIMVPVVVDVKELDHQHRVFARVYQEVLAKSRLKKLDVMFGTMIETPRAAIMGGEIAGVAEFFSFGTNDLTQMTYGFSRDDTGSFMGTYLEEKVIANDPFQKLDRKGVGELMKMAIERGRATRPGLKIGICGEHGGEPSSVEFCNAAGLNYVSCSPFRVPVARLAAAQAVARERKGSAVKIQAPVKAAGKQLKRAVEARVKRRVMEVEKQVRKVEKNVKRQVKAVTKAVQKFARNAKAKPAPKKAAVKAKSRSKARPKAKR
ncbi:MAG: pyruvate, phosphate dikinase [Myxococcota bacterium]|jgi:pyruvate,orthophosphate dikinase